MQRKWINRAELNKEVMFQISSENQLSTAFSAIMQKRGYTSAEINAFLSEDNTLYSALLLPDIEKSTQIVYDAVAEEENIKIGIVNDYDVDGITSGQILFEALTCIGANPFIITPDRDLDGYGISYRIIDEILKKQCKFIITCDNGISAVDQIDYAKKNGCTVIVTDHHEVQYTEDENGRLYTYPNADAIVNPKRPDSKYPMREICGAMVAYKFADHLISKYPINPEKKEYLMNRWTELAGIGTVCDVMPLVSENRSIVKKAITLLKNSSYIGLRQLIKVQNIDTEKMSSYSIGYMIGPALNACSRMTGSASLAQELLSEKDHIRAEKLATEIKKLNDERKTLSLKCEEEAYSLCANSADHIHILYIPNSSAHIMGIAAGRIKERTGHPCICLTDTGDGKTIKGSGRSIDGYDMFDYMQRYKDQYVSFGGHAGAIGITLEHDKLNTITRLLNQDMDTLDDNIYILKNYIDLYIPMSYITPQFVSELELIEPVGEGNPPVKLATTAYITNLKRIGSGNYLSLTLKENDANAVTAVYFGDAADFDRYVEMHYGEDIVKKLYQGATKIKMRFIYRPSFNEWKGRQIQYIISDYQTEEENA